MEVKKQIVLGARMRWVELSELIPAGDLQKCFPERSDSSS
jgi:hypothetical protein